MTQTERVKKAYLALIPNHEWKPTILGHHIILSNGMAERKQKLLSSNFKNA